MLEQVCCRDAHLICPLAPYDGPQGHRDVHVLSIGPITASTCPILTIGCTPVDLHKQEGSVQQGGRLPRQCALPQLGDADSMNARACGRLDVLQYMQMAMLLLCCCQLCHLVPRRQAVAPDPVQGKLCTGRSSHLRSLQAPTCFLNEKSELYWASATAHTLPPLPPLPPAGPPLSTCASLRKATHPLPPSPALM
jgi:hypothetical protein